MTTKLVDADYLTESELQELGIEKLRRLFVSYRRAALHLITRDDFDLHLARVDPTSPVAWVIAARSVVGICHRCKGSGTYYWGASINGRMTHSAPCARCAGKGSVNIDDCRRAFGYDSHAIRTACAV